MKDWIFTDKALLESSKGNIQLTLPAHFAGEVDARSVLGKASVGFPLQLIPDSSGSYGPEPSNHLRGRISDGGDQLRLYSYAGDVELLKGF